MNGPTIWMIITVYVFCGSMCAANYHDDVDTTLKNRVYFWIGMAWPLFLIAHLLKYVPVVGMLIALTFRFMLLTPYYLCTGLVGAYREVMLKKEVSSDANTAIH